MRKLIYFSLFIFLFVFVSPVLAAVDDSYTVTLHHFDNGGDESGRSWTYQGDAFINTDVYKFSAGFGDGSLRLDGNGDYIVASDSNDFFFPGDFTVEGWYKFTALPSNGGDYYLYMQYVNSQNHVYWVIHNTSGVYSLIFYARSSNTAIINFACNTFFSLDEWTHLALVRSGDDLYFARNGDIVCTSGSAAVIPDYAASVTIGGYSGGGYMNGNIDELRVSKSIPRFVDKYPVPVNYYGYVVPDGSVPVYEPLFGLTEEEEFMFLFFTCIGILILSRWWWVVLWVYLLPVLNRTSYDPWAFALWFVIIAAIVQFFYDFYREKWIGDKKSE